MVLYTVRQHKSKVQSDSFCINATEEIILGNKPETHIKIH
jgi:hypothetical protein